MRAISLWQPWASAMAEGWKRNETRSWPTAYRGDLLICSAKRKPRRDESINDENYAKALEAPRGFAVCIVEVYDCVPTSVFASPTNRDITAEEWGLGDYTRGRYAWLTRNLRKIRRPFPVRGFQGFFEVADELVIDAMSL